MEVDSAWCPTCQRQIQQMQHKVTIPSSNQPSPKLPMSTSTASNTKKGKRAAQKKAAAAQPQVVLRQKTIIDQGPTPLYCSEECELADLKKTPLAPREEEVKVAAAVAEPQEESSYDKLAKIYNFPPLPPRPPVFDTREYPKPHYEYNSGIMMAGKLIDSLCTKPSKHTGPFRPTPETKVVPGWNDGSHAWRASVYSFASPKSAQDPFHEIKQNAYGPPNTSPNRRPTKIYISCSLPASSVETPVHSASDDLLHKFSETFARRSENRISMQLQPSSCSRSSTAVPSSPTTSTRSVPLSPRRERNLVANGAEGRLCVPEGVTLKVRTGSTSSVCSSGNTVSSRSRSVKSPLSATSMTSEEEEQAVLYPFSRPKVETRSWSYDGLKTYPIMELPPKKIKKTEIQVIDGVEQEVEVEIEVHEERKRLFLFAPSIRVTV